MLIMLKKKNIFFSALHRSYKKHSILFLLHRFAQICYIKFVYVSIILSCNIKIKIIIKMCFFSAFSLRFFFFFHSFHVIYSMYNTIYFIIHMCYICMLFLFFVVFYLFLFSIELFTYRCCR